MKICKLIRRHSFLDVRVFQKEARSLARMGYDVTVMAPRMNGQLLNVNRKPLNDAEFKADSFVHEMVNVVPYRARHVVFAPQTAGIQNKWLQYLTGVTEDFYHDELLQKAVAVGADVYHAHEPETLCEAVQAKRLLRRQGRKVKVVFDAHELELDTPLLRHLMEEVDHMITVSDGIKSIFARRYPSTPVTVIYNSPNFAHPSRTEGSLASGSDAGRPFTIAYEGSLTKDKGDPHKILTIVKLLSEAGLDIKFKILGRVDAGSHSDIAKIENELRGHERIEYGWAAYQDIPDHWRHVDVGYIYFNLNVQNRMLALPNKFFSLLNSGIPIVVNAAPEMSDFIQKHQCGVVINKKNAGAEDYAQQFANLYHHRDQLREMSRKASDVMRYQYGWEMMEKELAEIYASLQA